MKKRFFLTALAVCIMGFSAMANEASAACQITGKVMFTAQTQTSATVYLAPIGTALWSFPAVYYSFNITTTTSGGAALIEKMNNAQTSGSRVTINGNAASCPTTGSVRSGGTILSVYQW